MLRHRRILKHSVFYLLTFDMKHKYESEHYYYMKRFLRAKTD